MIKMGGNAQRGIWLFMKSSLTREFIEMDPIPKKIMNGKRM